PDRQRAVLGKYVSFKQPAILLGIGIAPASLARLQKGQHGIADRACPTLCRSRPLAPPELNGIDTLVDQLAALQSLFARGLQVDRIGPAQTHPALFAVAGELENPALRATWCDAQVEPATVAEPTRAASRRHLLLRQFPFQHCFLQKLQTY